MKQLSSYSLILMLWFAFFLTSCAKTGEEEKGKIEKMTDHAAEVAVEKIRSPIEQAEAARELEDGRVKKLDEALEN